MAVWVIGAAVVPVAWTMLLCGFKMKLEETLEDACWTTGAAIVADTVLACCIAWVPIADVA